MDSDTLRFLVKNSAKPAYFMHRKCSWCGKYLGIKTEGCSAQDHGKISHGLCSECEKIENDKLDKGVE